MEDTDLDVRELERGLQVTFEVRDITVLGEVGAYLGEGQYVVTDENDNEHELNISQLTVLDED